MNTSNITNYKPKDFAELLGVSVKTLQRWDREGTLKANRTPTDRRYYTYNQYLQFKGIDTENDTRQVVIYARVSIRNQKDDLQNQVSFSLSYLILYPISKHTILAAYYFSQSKQTGFDFILLTGYSLQLLQAPANAKDKKHNRHIY